MHFRRPKAVTIAAFAALALLIPALPAAAPPAQAVTTSGAWLSEDDAPQTAALTPDIERARYAKLNTTAAVSTIVTPQNLARAVQGERIVVPAASPTVTLELFDAQLTTITIDEVALTFPLDSPSGSPGIEVLGTVMEDGAAMANAGLTFSKAAPGDPYTMQASIDDPRFNPLKVTHLSGDSYRIDQMVPVEPYTPPTTGDAGPPDSAPGGAAAPSGAEPGPPATVQTVDLLVGYTGINATTMRQNVDYAVRSANMALERSKAKIKINVVEIRAVNYTQTTSLEADWKILVKGTGSLAQLHQRRDATGADLVALIVPQSTAGYCGYGSIPPRGGSTSSVFSVTAIGCLGSDTLAHELGHNLGGDHDAANATAYSTYPYAKGSVFPGKGRTLMAYPCPDGSCRIQMPQFSNPAVDLLAHPGTPSGKANISDNVRSFNNLAVAVANYKKKPTPPPPTPKPLATDVPAGHKFYTEIKWMLDNKFATGYADGSFRPNEPVSREATAAFLYRYSGSPTYTPPAKSPFTDVPTTSQFYKQVTWLASKGITTGYADGTFKPKDPVARDAMSVFLYRLKGKPAFTPPTKSPFTDVPTTYKFYKEITWLRSTGITTGNANGTFAPLVSTSRADMSVFLYRYNAKFGK